MTQAAADPPATAPRGGAGEVLRAFLRLGLTSFGGPIAHLGYFRTEFVERRRWIDDDRYGELVTLGQFLPGPASSQVGFALGLLRAGPLGALAAFVGFTLPSAVLMVAVAFGASWLDGPLGLGLIEGLKLVAVAIVAQAVAGMARTLTPDGRRAAIAVGAIVIVVAFGMLGAPALGQLGAILAGGLAGLWLCRVAVEPEAPPLRFPVSKSVGVAALGLFAVLLAGLPVLAATVSSPVIALGDAFFRAGALVFGGGHVVLPLLEAEVVDPGWVSSSEFLAGYGAAQAMPGPLFTVAGYLGTLADAGPGGIPGAALALGAIFLPGLLLLIGVLPFWNTLRTRPSARALIRGANAAVVGILAAALYDPLITTTVTTPPTFAIAAALFTLLTAFRAPPWLIVLLGAAAGLGLSLLP